MKEKLSEKELLLELLRLVQDSRKELEELKTKVNAMISKDTK